MSTDVSTDFYDAQEPAGSGSGEQEEVEQPRERKDSEVSDAVEARASEENSGNEG